MTRKQPSAASTPFGTTLATESPLTTLTPVEKHQLRLPNRKVAGLENLAEAAACHPRP
jgi:hypothetical protein